MGGVDRRGPDPEFGEAYGAAESTAWLELITPAPYAFRQLEWHNDNTNETELAPVMVTYLRGPTASKIGVTVTYLVRYDWMKQYERWNPRCRIPKYLEDHPHV